MGLPWWPVQQLGKEGVDYALRNCFGVVTYEKPL
jgi:hypothetical protein